jgi:HEAT repeat protein
MRINLVFQILFLSLLSLSFSACLEAPETAIPKLINDLSAKESSVRNKAALKLASYKEDARPAVLPLIACLRDPNNGVRTSAAFALREIKDEKGLQAIDRYEK